MSVYKKFSPLDYATVPFNAHKQYDFNSASAALNKVTHFDTRWTSESISTYSGNSGSDDSINAIKYQQLDHLFYKNFKRDVNNKLGNNHYLKQRRVLYQDANILSIPAGLYGYQIKPGSFFLSSSNKSIIDDKNGNLLIDGTDTSSFVTDPRVNTLNIGPVKGFKRYDLNTIEGYVEDVFYKDGEKRVNSISTYNTPEKGDEFDDSYYFNIIEYKDVNFSEKILYDFDRFPGIDFNGSSSEIIVGHDDKFNYNKGDDFTLMFFTSGAENGNGATNYILSKNTTKTIVPSPSEGTAGIYTTQTTGAAQPIDVFSEPQFPFEVYLEHANNGPHVFFKRSDGEITTTVSASFNTSSITPGYDRLLINNQTDNTNITSSREGVVSYTSTIHRTLDGDESTNFSTGNSVDLEIGEAITVDVDIFGILGTAQAISRFDIIFGTGKHKQIQISGSNSISGVEGDDWAGIHESPTDYTLSSNRSIEFTNTTQYKWYRLRFQRYDISDVSGGFNRSDHRLDITELKFFINATDRYPQLEHVTCRYSSSQMQILINGVESGTSGSDNSIKQTQNTANIYIGSKGGKTNYYTGSLSQINIYNQALTNNQVYAHYTSNDGSPYVGNIFYSNGIVAITQPNVAETILAGTAVGEGIIEETLFVGTEEERAAYFGVNKLQFQGSHLIYEHEYQCTLDEHEFTDTLNPSARKIRSHQSADLADFATGSLFRPYITTIGLYNENNELLVVGKLGQPIRTSDETDTTLIVRWDT